MIQNNLSANGFSVPKAELRVIINGEEQKLLASIKYDGKGTYLFSIRNFTGIEALRVLLSNDSIKANDRLNRKYYFGKDDYLLSDYGIRAEMVKVLFGDVFLSQNSMYITDCQQDEATLKGVFKNFELKYLVSCKNGKALETYISDARGKSNLSGRFNKFKKDDIFVFPQNGILELHPSELAVNFKIKHIEQLSDSLLELIPGKNYERIILR